MTKGYGVRASSKFKIHVYVVESQDGRGHIAFSAFHSILVEVQTYAGYLHDKPVQQQPRD